MVLGHKVSLNMDNCAYDVPVMDKLVFDVENALWIECAIKRRC